MTKERIYPLYIVMKDGKKIAIEYKNGRFVFVGSKKYIDEGVKIFMKEMKENFSNLLKVIPIQEKIATIAKEYATKERKTFTLKFTAQKKGKGVIVENISLK